AAAPKEAAPPRHRCEIKRNSVLHCVAWLSVRYVSARKAIMRQISGRLLDTFGLRTLSSLYVVLLFSLAPLSAPAVAQQPKPNILAIMGDDIGYWNISAYNRGMMGYRTPNIDRIASEGAIFTDYYGQQSCTAGRAAFITGQSPLRTGLLKVGLPSAKEGLSA